VQNCAFLCKAWAICTIRQAPGTAQPPLMPLDDTPGILPWFNHRLQKTPHPSFPECPTGKTLKLWAPRLLLPPSSARPRIPALNSGESSAESRRSQPEPMHPVASISNRFPRLSPLFPSTSQADNECHPGSSRTSNSQSSAKEIVQDHCRLYL